jgi:hypothetical protein
LDVSKENSKKRGPPFQENPGPSKVPRSQLSDVGQNRNLIVNLVEKSEHKEIPMIDLVDSESEDWDPKTRDASKKEDSPKRGDTPMEVEDDIDRPGSTLFDEIEEDLPQDDAMASFSQVS